MSKYKINKEFFPFSLLKPPIMNPNFAGKLGSMMKPPRWIYKDKEINTTKYVIDGYNSAKINVFVMEPKNIKADNCLIYYHGGGFFFEGASYHYKNVKDYALNCPCKVIFVEYRLAPKNPFPIPVEDSYNALIWAYNHADELGINKNKIAVAGDSAGGAIAASVSKMIRDRNKEIKLLFQLLIYPVLDLSMSSDSNKKYTKTPMWNSSLSIHMVNGYIKDKKYLKDPYASLVEGELNNLPYAYIETAEFDCLHDEGLIYANKLLDAGNDVEINETIGTMHGFDIVRKAKTTKAAINKRISFMKKRFEEKCS